MKTVNESIASLEKELTQPLDKLKEYYQSDRALFDGEVEKLKAMSQANQLYKHNANYEQSVMMSISSWRERKDK